MTKGFAQAVFWRVFATASSVVTVFLSLRLYDRHLGKELYGLVAAALQVIAYLPLLDGGFRLAGNRALLAGPSPSERRRILEFGQTLYTLAGAGALAVGLLLMAAYACSPNARASGQPITFFLSLGALGAAISIGSAQTRLLTGLGQQARLFALNALNTWLNLAALWFGFRYGMGAWTFPFAILVALLGTVPLAIWWIRQSEPEFRVLSLRLDDEFRIRLRRLWPEASAALQMEVITVLLYSCDVVLVQLLCPVGPAGVYALAARLFTMVRTSLQAADEAVWPILAQRTAGGANLSATLVRLNAWVYGAVMAAAAVTLPAFLRQYLKGDWQPEPVLVWLFALRYLITGLCSQPAYFLYGAGRFDVLARNLGRELVVAAVLALPLGWKFGTLGVGLAFALATVAGTFVPLPFAYATLAGVTPAATFANLWLRALAAALAAAAVAFAGLHFVTAWPLVVALGGIAAGAALLPVLAQACFRAWRAGKVDVRTVAQFI